MALHFHSTKWTKIHDESFAVLRNAFTDDEYATLVTLMRQEHAGHVMRAAAEQGQQAYEDAIAFLTLWGKEMTSVARELALDYAFTATWSWQERR